MLLATFILDKKNRNFMRIYALTYFVAILIYKLRAMCDNVKLPAEDLILFITYCYVV